MKIIEYLAQFAQENLLQIELKNMKQHVKRQVKRDKYLLLLFKELQMKLNKK
jgi:hypothetical protein